MPVHLHQRLGTYDSGQWVSSRPLTLPNIRLDDQKLRCALFLLNFNKRSTFLAFFQLQCIHNWLHLGAAAVVGGIWEKLVASDWTPGPWWDWGKRKHSNPDGPLHSYNWQSTKKMQAESCTESSENIVSSVSIRCKQFGLVKHLLQGFRNQGWRNGQYEKYVLAVTFIWIFYPPETFFATNWNRVFGKYVTFLFSALFYAFPLIPNYHGGWRQKGKHWSKEQTSPHNSIVQKSVRFYNREQNSIVGSQKFLFGSELYDPYFKPALAAMMTVKEGVIGVISQKHWRPWWNVYYRHLRTGVLHWGCAVGEMHFCPLSKFLTLLIITPRFAWFT